MRKDLTIPLIALIILTIITIAVFNGSLTVLIKNGLIIGLSYIKILLVAYYFMELKKAHLFWKMSLTGLMGLIALLIFLL